MMRCRWRCARQLWWRVVLLAAATIAAVLHADVSRRFLDVLSLRPHTAARKRHNAPTSPLARLARLEAARSRHWNRSTARMLVLGQKSSRDFGVYLWAFAVHHFRIASAPSGVFFLGEDPQSHPAAAGLGALLCHSLFLSNCVRPKDRQQSAAQAQGAVFDRVRGMKINRIAGVRQVLSTKDGLCLTLRASGLSTVAMWDFSFPCWVLPHDSARLEQHIRESSGAVARMSDSPGGSTTVSPPAWIVKPAHGSHGMGIRVINSTRELYTRLLAPPVLSSLKSPFVVTPYLREPLLHHGRKWDVRCYVIATSVLPMRLYLFSEAIVRYAASATYSPGSTDDGTVLTNTFVGKQLLQRGVGAITGSLADLCSEPSTGTGTADGAAANASASAGKGSRRKGSAADRCSRSMLDAMRDAIGRVFLAAEPRMRQFYNLQYARPAGRGGHMPDDEGEGARESGDASFRCAECYHLFGVDLIADAQGRMHVIEINVSPDLSLSTQGATCHHSASNCTDGSTAYDHTKLAAAYNTVNLVYSRHAAAEQLQRLIERHALAISRLDLLVLPPSPPASPMPPTPPPEGSVDSSVAQVQMPTPLVPADPDVPVQQQDVAEYVLDALREQRAAGCFATVYPSTRHHDDHGELLKMMARSRLLSCPTEIRPDTAPECVSLKRRLQMHTLLGIVMRDQLVENERRGASFTERCEQMLRDVPRSSEGSWARRTHIFGDVPDLVS